MSTIIDCDGFVTSIGCDLSVADIKKSTIDSVRHTTEDDKEESDQNQCVQCRALKSKINSLSDENSRLKELNNEISEIDIRRQKYDLERQDYIQRLLKTIKKLQLRSSTLITSDSQINVLPLTDRQRAIHMSSDQSQSDDKQQNDKSLLQKSYENALKENVNLQKELDELRSNFDTLIEQLSAIESEHIQVLEFQAKLHREDYEVEKREKENAVTQVKQLNSENHRLREICKNYEKKLQKFVEVLGDTHFSSKNDLKHSSSQTKVANTNAEHFKTNSLPNTYKFKPYKSTEVNKSEKDCNLSKGNCKMEEMKEIECPNCQMAFPVQYQVQLLQHFEKCQKSV